MHLDLTWGAPVLSLYLAELSGDSIGQLRNSGRRNWPNNHFPILAVAAATTRYRERSRRVTTTRRYMTPKALEIIAHLKRAGANTCLFVGGCVRDYIMGDRN